MEKKINRGVIRTGETDIKVHLIDSFPNHPYHVFDDEDMTELAASIEANGLLNPIIVRSKADGRYELISGHRRKRAYEILKINKIRAIIVDVSDDEAIIMMVDSNCQRSKILPSEKAFSYKMKLDAIKRQGKRNDLTSTQVVSKLRSNEELGKEVNESRETIRRFIRLTNLIPELLDFVDKGRMKMQPAVELSYLDEESQRDLVDIICVRMELGAPDERGRRRPVVIPDSEFTIDVDTVIMSIGTSPNPLIKSTTEGLEVNRWGGIVVNEDGLTSRNAVYAGGDAVTGAATVISAMGAGKTAAKAIDDYLSK